MNYEAIDKKKKLEELLAKLLVPSIDHRELNVRESGNRIRHLTRVIAASYKNDPEELRKFFEVSDQSVGNLASEEQLLINQFVAGIATSAYHFLTGDITSIQTVEYGGLGAIISKSEPNLKFSKEQLNYAKISGTSLKNSRNKAHALWYSENSENALQNSKNKEGALIHSINSGSALKNSRNKGCALQDSQNSENALRGSKSTGYSLRFSTNIDNAKKLAINTDDLRRERDYANIMQANRDYESEQSRPGVLTRAFNSFCQFLDDYSKDRRYGGTSGIFIPSRRD